MLYTSQAGFAWMKTTTMRSFGTFILIDHELNYHTLHEEEPITINPMAPDFVVVSGDELNKKISASLPKGKYCYTWQRDRDAWMAKATAIGLIKAFETMDIAILNVMLLKDDAITFKVSSLRLVDKAQVEAAKAAEFERKYKLSLTNLKSISVTT